jgi:pimeloyl-ACP methyl ester carboxylesterase
MHEDRLNSLVLSGSILLPSDPEYAAFRANLAAAPPGQPTNVPVEYREVGACYRAGNPEGFAEWQALEHLAHPGDWNRDQPWGADRNNAAFEKLTIPVLLQTGDTDMGIPPSLIRLFKPHFKNSELRLIEEAGHNTYWEQPEAFNASILDFISRHGSRS